MTCPPRLLFAAFGLAAALNLAGAEASAQPGPAPGAAPGSTPGPGQAGRQGAGGGFIVAGPGPGGGGQERPIVAQFDADKDGRLNTAERQAAREFLAQPGNAGRGGPGRGGGRGGGGRGGANRPPASPGVRLTPADVKHFGDAPLYDAATLRTFFIELDNPDWEAELVAFNNTDVDVPARVTVDGKTYRDVGVHFRGNSSFGVGNGYKRSLNLSFDFVDEDQAIGGYRTLNFLNANDDPTFMHTVLSMYIARQYIPAPKANFVRVVINGENWGIYANAQQFNKEFVQDNFKTTKGTRWKIPQGGGGGIGGFRYLGDDPASYRNVFQIKSKDEPAAWAALIKLAKTLQDTPAEQLEAALRPMLDIDGYLRFLALDNVLSNGDGFYARTADYSLYLDVSGRFHFVFHDVNEMFSAGGGRGGPGGGVRGGPGGPPGGGPGGPGGVPGVPGGPGGVPGGRGGPGGAFPGGPGGGGITLSPLVSQDDANKPIISKILAVPALRTKYLTFVREIAQTSLDWNTLGPVVKQYRDLIADDVARETRKLYSTEEFVRGTADDGTLRTFIDQRRAFLLNWTPQ